MHTAKAYSAASATSPLARTTIARRDLTEQNVLALTVGSSGSQLSDIVRAAAR